MEETQSIWKDFNIPWDDLIEYKASKIAPAKDVLPYWNLLVEKLEKRKEFFFQR